MNIFPLEVNEGDQKITKIRHRRGEWIGGIFVTNIFEEEKYKYGGEWSKTPWWRVVLA